MSAEESSLSSISSVVIISSSRSTGIAGLEPKPNKQGVNSRPLTNFGFIPRKKTRDLTGEISGQIQNLILDPEQSTPIICDVPINSRSDEIVEKELNHNPKSVLGRKRIVENNVNSSVEKREYKDEQSTVAMVRKILQLYPTIFSASGPRKSELHCDICFKTFRSAKMTHVTEHLETILHKKNFEKRNNSHIQVVRQRNFIKQYFDESRAKGESLDMETLSFRVDTVKSFLRNGVPILKIDG